MEEDEYRSTYNSVNRRRCAFEKALHSRKCKCVQSERFYLADREGVSCLSSQCQLACGQLLDEMRSSARFALRMTLVHGPLPHNKEIKVQSGGLRGLQSLLHPEQADEEEVRNIAGLVEEARARFGDIESIPYDRIMPYIVSHEGRRKRRRDR